MGRAVNPLLPLNGERFLSGPYILAGLGSRLISNIFLRVVCAKKVPPGWRIPGNLLVPLNTWNEQAYGGSNGDFTTNFGTSVRGRSPSTLLSVTLPATLSSATFTGDGNNAPANSSSLWYTITELETGEPYFVRVSASNARGLGLPRGSNPAYLAPPKQVPANPEDVHIFPATSSSLRYEQSITEKSLESVWAGGRLS